MGAFICKAAQKPPCKAALEFAGLWHQNLGGKLLGSERGAQLGRPNALPAVQETPVVFKEENSHMI